MNWGDIPAWVALAVALGAATLTLRSLHWEKQSAQAAMKSADEAARANLIAQRALDEAKGSDSSAHVAPEERDVAWKVERGSGAKFVLRNTGSDTAEHVYVDLDRAPVINRRLPQDSVVHAGAGHTMMLAGSFQRAMPTELYLRWAGHDEWAAVPLPT